MYQHITERILKIKKKILMSKWEGEITEENRDNARISTLRAIREDTPFIKEE